MDYKIKKMRKPKILAVSASLRNARWGKGIDNLIDKIKKIPNKEELMNFIFIEARVHFEQFIDAGRKDGVPFDELYKNLRKLTGKKGLCNSEIGMVVALWSAYQEGCDIEYVPLSSHFGPTTRTNKLAELKQQLQDSDALLLCTPVYFGDRSSVASDFIEFIRKDEDILSHLSGKPMAGISVGAKRNGGQETTLVYQLLEMTQMGMLGLGNNTETSSQYGGTIMAGDIGTAADDEYGIKSSLGTGKRLARIARIQNYPKKIKLKGKLKVQFWILQDSKDYALNKIKELIELSSEDIVPEIINVTDGDIGRCIACDICPTHVGKDEEYRCIIKRKKDKFVHIHEQFLDNDIIVPVTHSPKDRKLLRTAYQRFIERTRYLRRGDYLFSDVSVMPIVFEEIGSSENLGIRLLTSLIRHQTIMHAPNIGYIHNNNVLNFDEMKEKWLRGIHESKGLTISRLNQLKNVDSLSYNPVGYILSVAADNECSVEERRKILQTDREIRNLKNVKNRLIP
ncbi:hypothetical protein HOL24_14970 [bacterium]|mgnify:CR=1 FL=1|jgi:multimeric flavodoxin WrbA|nr:hypothetical protein [bacterium]